MIKLAGVSSFQWSASEQIWPFEKDNNGNTLYCRETLYTGLSLGTWNTFPVAFLTNRTKLFRFDGWYDLGFMRNPIVFANPGTSQDSQQTSVFIADDASPTYVAIYGYAIGSGHTCTIRYTYIK